MATSETDQQVVSLVLATVLNNAHCLSRTLALVVCVVCSPQEDIPQVAIGDSVVPEKHPLQNKYELTVSMLCLIMFTFIMSGSTRY